METKLNKQYEDLINKLQYALDTGVSEESLPSIKDVMYALHKLGQRPVLEKNAQQFSDITTNMLKTYIAKNHDYGNSFGESLDEFGLVASVVRLGDKMNRIKSLIKKEAQVKDESIKDTLLDMANYAIMTVMWMNKQNEK